MAQPTLLFAFKVDTIEAAPNVVPQFFAANGFYKPPIRKNHYEESDSTGWMLWTTNAIVPITAAQLAQVPSANRYATTVFYDGVDTNRFLFHPADCRTLHISTVQNAHGERWGWQQLRFTEVDADHSVLNHVGEFPSLCGQPGSYSPHLLPHCYRSQENNTVCGLSGKMSLLIALTAFSCAPENMLSAIRSRLDLGARRWDDALQYTWGHGRKLQSHAILASTNDS
jgi:hypothetical protein